MMGTPTGQCGGEAIAMIGRRNWGWRGTLVAFLAVLLAGGLLPEQPAAAQSGGALGLRLDSRSTGDGVLARLYVRNDGAQAIQGLTVRLSLPAGATAVESWAGLEGLAPGQASGDLVVWNDAGASLAPGQTRGPYGVRLAVPGAQLDALAVGASVEARAPAGTAAAARAVPLLVTPAPYPSDAAQVDATLYRRADVTSGAPAVVIAPGGSGVPGLYHDQLAAELAAGGAVVLVTPYRPGLRIGTLMADDADLSHGVSYLQALAAVDPARIGLFGHSRGAMASLRTTAKDPRVRAVVALAPPALYEQQVPTLTVWSPFLAADRVRSSGGTPEEIPDYYRAGAAINYAAEIRVPVLLLHGDRDFVAPPDNSLAMAEALAAAGNSRVELVLIPGMGHMLEMGSERYNYDAVIDLAREWLLRTL
jgi:dienelactone hydrolase